MNNEFKQIYKLEGYTLEEIMEIYKEFQRYRKPYERKWDLVKQFHDGDMWKELGKGLPEYYIRNDTNFLEYIEKAIKNSVYTGDFRAVALPRSVEDNEAARQLNRFIDMTMDTLKFKTFLPKLGKNAILYNVSYIRVDWDSNKVFGKKGKQTLGGATIKHLQPKEVYLDPNVTDLQNGQALFITNQVNINILKKNKFLSKGVTEYLKQLKAKGIKENEIPASSYISDEAKKTYSSRSKTLTITEAFYRTSKGIDQIFIANGEFIIYFKENIQPEMFPIVALYGEDPDKGPYGFSMANKILYNIVSYNMISTLENTYIYATQNRGKLLSANAGINYRSFTKFGNDPHKAWIVNGNPNEVVRYIEVPELPNFIHLTKETIKNDIMTVTGVDLRYTGRDTGSIQTTGGTDLSQQRIIGQTDNSRISAMENFVEELTGLIINYYKEYGDTYPIFKRNVIKGNIVSSNPDGTDDTINFNDLKDIDFQFSLDAAPQLPKNKIRIAQAATEIMEAQAQYGMPELITPQEWLSYQDFPQKELMLERMEANAMNDDQTQLQNDLMNFAGLIEGGLSPEEAIEIMVDEKKFLRDNPDIDLNTKG